MEEITETPENIDMQKRVESDKRSILEYVLKINPTNPSELITESDPINIKNSNNNPISDAEYDTLFGDEDIDDSEEIFEQILKKAEEAYKREKELKKKDPFYKNICDSFKSPIKKTRKRKSTTDLTNSFDLINTFRKSLSETQEQKKTRSNSTYESIANKSTSLKKSCIPVKNQSTARIYPAWKTTATYTPIFPASSNPRWTNKQFSSKLTKIYTPQQHIYNRINDDTNTEINPPSSSYKNIRSDDATCSSAINNESFITTITSPIKTSTPMRSTIVRFKPSPPEHFSYSIYSSSPSISPSSFVMEENEQSDEGIDDFKMCETVSTTHRDENCQSPLEMFQDYSKKSNHSEKRFEYKENIQKNCFDNNDSSKETNGSVSNDPTKQPFFFEDFIRNLNNNISNNYNMEVKCSMKLKYFQ